jgi:glycosyltransferase involved in cell wall biosynthesis
MKIFYLSDTCFSDCEINLLKALGNDNEITYAVISHKFDNSYTREDLIKAFENSNVTLNFIKLQYRLRDPRQIFRYFKLINFILEQNADIVYINNWGDVYFNSLASTFLKKKNTIIGIHDVIYHSGSNLSSVFNFSNRIFYRKFDTFLTFSKSQASILKATVPQKRVVTIPLALKDFGTKPHDVQNDGIVRFLFFGNILPYKGLKFLIKATNALSKKYNNFKLIIAGKADNWEKSYGHLVKDQDYIETKIRFIANEEIPHLFANAHYLVLPYKDVTQSGPLMVAYNYDVPAIATNIDGFKEFIENSVSGYLFNRGDELELQNILESAILRSEAEYNELVQNVVKIKENELSFNVTLRKYREMFNLLA